MHPKILLAFLALAAPLSAAVKLASPFTDHMVLQREMKVPVWGTADAGEQVAVEFAGQKKTATAGADGQWRVTLDPLTASAESRDFVVSGTNRESKIENQKLSDVLVGEVWLASGQSNMAFPVSKARASYAGLLNEEQEIAAANFPLLRMFTAASVKSYELKTTVGGEWLVCSPQTVPNFSAMGYLFGRDLHQALHVPVGIVTVAYGASCAEAWISREALAADPQLKFMLDSLDECVKFFRTPAAERTGAAPIRPTPINKPRTPNPRLTDPAQDQHFATVLFNGMLNPVIPFAIRGAIWYQGESICWGTRGLDLYGHVQQAMIRDWRARWGEGDFPFYLVQLPGQENISNNPRIREEQAAVLALPHTGMAVAIDTGEAKNVHPHNKEPTADRLARLALADVYGRKIEARSPMFAALKIEGANARVQFSHAAAGLAAKGGGALKGFQVAGADQKFVDADARVDGDSVVVSSAQVPQPVAVRYAWCDYPEGVGCNLVSGDLPAAPFRTDKWNYPIEGLVEH
ncbi:MAG TPA: sialate O-acetylesterase [Opitutaceae bacterium]|nr:sialate O-acetylesterase [Opitutaceae bacterium]